MLNFRFNSAFTQTNETKFKAEIELSWIWFDAEIKLTGNYWTRINNKLKEELFEKIAGLILVCFHSLIDFGFIAANESKQINSSNQKSMKPAQILVLLPTICIDCY